MQKDTAFTGFIARYNGDECVIELNNYFDNGLKKTCATNWHSVDKAKVMALEIWWHGECKAKLPLPEDEAKAEWKFFHSGGLVLGEKSPVLTSRTIGVKAGRFEKLYTVDEKTGELKTSIYY